MPELLALYDDERIAVYQAFKASTVAASLEQGRFAAGFNRRRLTWIKPSFGWMLHRSRYATARRQEAILRIWLHRPAFEALLRRSVPTVHDPATYPEVSAWRRALDLTTVRHQWDPERDLRGRPTGARAIQIGLSGDAVDLYADEAIAGLEELTPLARAIAEAIERRRPLPEAPQERPYPLPDDLAVFLRSKDKAKRKRVKSGYGCLHHPHPNPLPSRERASRGSREPESTGFKAK